MNNWENIRFENAPLEVIDGDRGVNYPKQSDFMTSGHCLFLNAGNVTEIGFDFSDCSFINEAKDNKLRKGKLTRHDIVLTTRGTVGNLAFYDDRIPFENIRLNSGMVIIRPNKELIFPRYLYFSLKSSIFKEQVSAFVTGSAQPQLPIRDINRIEFPLPPLSEQRAIAGILGALDDKIEVNRRMNVTLESMARAVFREMTKDEKYKSGSILEFANLLSGGTPSTSEESYWNGNIEWVSAKDAGNVDSIFLLDTEKKITQKGVDNSSTKMLPQKTTVVTARGTVGAHCMLGKPMTINQSNYGLKAKDGIGDYFVYFSLSEMVEQLKQQSYGTIFDTITTKTFYSVRCVHPPHDVIRKFESQVTPLMDAILNNQKESRTLGSLRDSLLPKLMRGEVRVSAL